MLNAATMTIGQGLTLIVSFGIAYFVSRSGKALWIKLVAYFIGFIVAWFGGTFIVGALFVTEQYTDAVVNLLARGFWFSLVGSGIGIIYGRHKRIG